MSLLVFSYSVFFLVFIAVPVSNHFCVVCRHFICLMLLFQGRVACQNIIVPYIYNDENSNIFPDYNDIVSIHSQIKHIIEFYTITLE